ncbi:MAG: hypothetical protein EBW27_02200 [Acidimicrobiia bacterium]|nr:hypothetical protein [Acidimicrobiia bacterium]
MSYCDTTVCPQCCLSPDARWAMIGSLRGRVLERLTDTTVLVETAGVGYVVNVTPRTLGELEPTTERSVDRNHRRRPRARDVDSRYPLAAHIG